MTAAEIAELRIEVGRGAQDARQRRAGEGWGAWISRGFSAGKGGVPEPEPEHEASPEPEAAADSGPAPPVRQASRPSRRPRSLPQLLPRMGMRSRARPDVSKTRGVRVLFCAAFGPDRTPQPAKPAAKGNSGEKREGVLGNGAP